MKKLYLTLILHLMISGVCFGQYRFHRNSSFQNNRDVGYISFRKNVVPACLITGGILIDAFHIKKQVQDFFPGTDIHIEDFLQYVPIAILYGGDLVEEDHANTVFDQTKYLIISELATGILTHALKLSIPEMRPDGGTQSFPSGHTSLSFSAASVVYNEFIDDNSKLASWGYTFSTATGLLRITNNRHWVPDVLVGAGMAMIITNLVYYFEPLKNWDPFHWNNRYAVIPQVQPDLKAFAISISYRP